MATILSIPVCASGPSKSIRYSGDFVITGFVIVGFVSTYFTVILPGFQMFFVITGLRYKGKSFLGTPGRVNNSRPKYCANRESVPFTLGEAIFEVSREAISK